MCACINVCVRDRCKEAAEPAGAAAAAAAAAAKGSKGITKVRTEALKQG